MDIEFYRKEFMRFIMLSSQLSTILVNSKEEDLPAFKECLDTLYVASSAQQLAVSIDDVNGCIEMMLESIAAAGLDFTDCDGFVE